MDFKATPQSGHSYLHIWDVASVKVYDGGFLLDKSNLPAGLKRLPKATYFKVDLTERIARAIKTVTLIQAVTTASNEVRIKKGSLLIKGDTIGIEGKSVTVGDIDTTDDQYDSFAIVPDSLGELPVNTVLQSYQSGEVENPDGFNYTETKIDAQPSVTVVYQAHGVVAERLPFPLTGSIIAALKFCQILIK